MRVNYYGRDYLLVIGIYHDSVTGKYYNGCFYNNARVFYVGRANDSSGYNRASYISDASFNPCPPPPNGYGDFKQQRRITWSIVIQP